MRKTKTGFSTDEAVLEQLASQHPLPARILAFRRLAKLKSTYVDALPPLVDAKTGRIHPDLPSDGCGDRAPVGIESERAEHPDPQR